MGPHLIVLFELDLGHGAGDHIQLFENQIALVGLGVNLRFHDLRHLHYGRPIDRIIRGQAHQHAFEQDPLRIRDLETGFKKVPHKVLVIRHIHQSPLFVDIKEFLLPIEEEIQIRIKDPRMPLLDLANLLGRECLEGGLGREEAGDILGNHLANSVVDGSHEVLERCVLGLDRIDEGGTLLGGLSERLKPRALLDKGDHEFPLLRFHVEEFDG